MTTELLHGFRLKRVRPLMEQKAILHEYTHEKSGAELAWLEREEQNKTFCISFKTLPSDDTGVFHILEHSVLGGSKKYAIKDPFAELLKNSVNTFLNAMTFNDKTIYPVASRNEKDFFNLVSVYLDAVFNPAVLENEFIFRQEGWDYAFDEEGNPSYQGVVYNEMKGTAATLDRTAFVETLRLLFPDSFYRFDAGGDPAAILDLTYEAFKEAHQKFYHPSNALIFLDGKLPLARVLEKLDQDYLQHYDKKAPVADIGFQEPLGGVVRHDYEIGPDEDPTDKCRLTLATLFTTWDDVEKQLATHILCDVLAGSNEAPLKKIILEQGLAQDFRMTLSGGFAQPWFSIEAHNTSEAQFATIKETIRDTLLRLSEVGLNHDDLLASLNQYYYQELDPMEPRGIMLAIASLSSWLYGGDPALFLNLSPFFATLRAKIATGYFETLLLELIPDVDRFVEIQSIPSESYGRERDAREAARLTADVAAWTEQDRTEKRERAAALERWQVTPNSAEELASLPSLDLADLAVEPTYMATGIDNVAGVTVLTHPSPVEGIVQLRAYVDISDQPWQDLASLQFMTLLLGKLATKKRSAEALVREVKTRIGLLNFQIQPLEDREHLDRCKLYFTVTCSLLSSEVPEAIELMQEMLTETLFTDKASIYAQLMQHKEYYRQLVAQLAHHFGTLRTKGHYTAKDAASEALEGLSFIEWMKDFLANVEARWPDWQSTVERFRDGALTKDRLTLSITGEVPASSREKLATMLPNKMGQPAGHAHYAVAYPKEEGLLLPTAVSYAIMSCHNAPFGGKFSGYAMALDQILSMNYLWNKIRVQGGAYGTGFSTDDLGGSSCYSYMDPTPKKSIATFRHSADFLRTFCAETASIAHDVMGKIAELDPDLSYKAQADQADRWYFTGYTVDDALTVRRQLLQAESADLLPLVEILDDAMTDAALFVAGPADALENIPGLTYIDIG